MGTLESYFTLFINRDDIWFKQIIVAGKASYIAVHEPVDLDVVARHLSGDVTCSWSAASATGMCKWLAWDADNDLGDLEKVETTLRHCGFNPLREGGRAGRAGHLWLFLDQPVTARQVRRFNREVLANAGVATDSLEFFPKSERGHSQLRGPLGVHRKPSANGERGWFDGAERNVEAQIIWLAEQPLNSGDLITMTALKLFDLDAKEPHSQRPVHSEQTSFSKPVYGRIDLRELFPKARRQGDDLVDQCPLCADEGHDSSRDNLRISVDGVTLCCVFRGPGQVHKFRDILRAVRGHSA